MFATQSEFWFKSFKFCQTWRWNFLRLLSSYVGLHWGAESVWVCET